MERTGQLARLLRHLGAYGGDSAYFSFCQESEDRALWRSDLGTLVCRPDREPNRPLRYALRMPFIHRRALKQCDVLRCTSLLAAIPAMVAKATLGLPFVVSHGADYIEIARIHGQSRSHILKWQVLQRAAMAMASAIIVQNYAMARTLRALYPRAEIVHLPNWVDPEVFRPSSRSAFGHRTVLYVGRLVKEKNLLTLARACRRADATLLCLGEGPLREELAGLGAVTPGPVPWERLPDYYAKASAFAMVSHTEGHCKALAEAMAAGMPCIVSTAVREGIRHGVNALQVRGDESHVEQAIRAVLGNPEFAARLAFEARRTAVTCWSPGALLEQELDTLRAAAR